MAEPRRSESAEAAAWLDRFFDAYYRQRPVNATFIGAHEHDQRLPDFSESGAGGAAAEMGSLLHESERLEPAALDPIVALDVRLARGFLRTQLWEYASGHFHRGNPSTHTGEAVFGVISLLFADGVPLAERVAAAEARLREIPGFLRVARTQVRAAPRAWTERAIRECVGALALLREGVGSWMGEKGVHAPGLLAEAAAAATAFAAHHDHLQTTLLGRTSGSYACGDEALAIYLRDGHFLHESADEIARYAEAELREAQASLQAHASDFGASTPEQALATLSSLAPTEASYLARYQQTWDEARSVAEAHALLTWPELPIRYVPQPAWTRAAAPHLYFLPYRSPAALQHLAVHEYLVTPIEAEMPAAERARRLSAHNDSAIKLNHVVHHGGIGHHVQNARAFQAASRIGRIAGVDCAARIALFCGGTMAEGWACYATDLMAAVGFLTPLERYAEHHTRQRMCARAVVDVRLHQGRLTLEEAAAYYRSQAGMSPEAAHAEAVKNSMFPGTALMYLMGTDAIHRLRAELQARRGARFTLRAFHDELLSYGTVPVSLIGEALRSRGGGDAR